MNIFCAQSSQKKAQICNLIVKNINIILIEEKTKFFLQKYPLTVTVRHSYQRLGGTLEYVQTVNSLIIKI